ncbi:MAG: hypothetical protein ACRENS_00470 [Candidatus Eiseniibacteriota bacterium]
MAAGASGQCSGAHSASAAGACPYAGSSSANAVHAVSGQCPYAHGSAATAVTASTAGAAGSDHCGAAAAGSASAGCSGAASAKSSASHCQGDGLVKMADQTAHTDCDGCSDMAHCESEIMHAGGHVQVIQLKNGVMYMYTAESSAGVRAVQAALSHRNERLAAWTTAGDHVHLCAECKSMRGAAASGKLTREVVNIEGGCLTLVTSTDPTIVAKLHTMAQAASARSKI